MKRGLILAVVSAGLSSLPVSSTLSQDFGFWRALTTEEEKARIGDASANSIDPTMIEADFDGDGRKDKALIAIRKIDGARGLIAVLNGRVHVISPDGMEPSDGLGLAKRGISNTDCVSPIREFHDFTHYPSRVMLKNPGILWIGNGRTSLHFWDRKKKQFDTVLMVD